MTDTTVGLEVTKTATLNVPNLRNGIQIDGHAHNNAIGGFQASVEPQVTISNNNGYGIAIVGSARDNAIFNSYIGTGYLGTGDLQRARWDLRWPRHFVHHDRRHVFVLSEQDLQ